MTRLAASWRWMWLLLLAAGGGCAREAPTLSTAYGGRRADAAASVNGLSILAEMFRAAGHRVSSRSNTTTGIDDAQVIVWAPNNFAPPTLDERNLIEAWLAADAGRTFVYIGRDYDAAVDYWRRMADAASPAEYAEAKRQAALARSAHDTARSEIPAKANGPWFSVQRDRPRRRIDSLSGKWADGIDVKQANIMLQSQFGVPTKEKTASDDAKAEEKSDDAGDRFDASDFENIAAEHEVLLAAPADGNPFDPRSSTPAPLVMSVWKSTWGSSEVIVVTNGSFLLNLPLVNHEHRKLAGRLIERCGEPGKVVFWESPAFRAMSGDDENEWSALTTWPLNFILLHFAVLGMLYILWRFPIFGLAHSLRAPATADFSKHVDALGKLMAATNDEGYARRKLAEYRERVLREEKGRKQP